jgi:hypothetical protein
MARDAAETAESWRFLGPLRYDLAGFYHVLLNKLNFAKIGASATDAPVATAGAYHLLTIVHFCTPHLSCLKPLYYH